MSISKQRVKDEDIIAVFEQSDDPFLSATEIADSVDMTRQGVHARLDQLLERGVVRRKRIGSRAVGWWLANQSD